MSAIALFSLKDPSLLAFDSRRNDENLRNLFGIQEVPCDTQLRAILDRVDPEELRPAFGDVFRELQRGKALKPFVVCRACLTVQRCKSSTQPDGGEGLAKRKGVVARRGLKAAWSKRVSR
jgi:hypothetical protein